MERKTVHEGWIDQEESKKSAKKKEVEGHVLVSGVLEVRAKQCDGSRIYWCYDGLSDYFVTNKIGNGLCRILIKGPIGPVAVDCNLYLRIR